MSDQPNTAIMQSVEEPHQERDPVTAMIQRALDTALASGDNGLAVANLMIEQMTKQRDYEDKLQFNAALRRIQDKLKPVARDLDNPGRGKYASAASIDEAISGLCQQERMSLTFDTEDTPDPMFMRLVCDVTRDGYTRRYRLPLAVDGSGPKGGGVMNRTQAGGSAVTFGKRYLKNMIFNLRIREKDDDGNRAGGVKIGRLGENVRLNHRDNINNSATLKELERCYLNAIGDAEKVGDGQAIQEFAQLKNIRVEQLRKEAGK